MLLDYVRVAMAKATYELLPEGEGFYGEIPGFDGVWANAPTLEGCRNALESALEDWILFSVERHILIPAVDGIELWPRPAPPTQVA